ncbi:uncharacterized protein LOC136095520 [Hydra vulgaris]|uniref:uncharacterized protein LOC136095520 n=1 Tax=Hydra vulgaris TaxID=6087 RepID=UPI0032EA3997
MEETPKQSRQLETTSQSPSSTTTCDVQIDINDPALWPVPLNSKNSDKVFCVCYCTPDVSHSEQLSFTLRFVDISSDEIEIKEHFLTNQTVEKFTGQSLFEIFQKLLEDLNLNLMNCRGLVIWYNILYRVNIVSKSMQSAAMDIVSVVSLMKSCAEFATEYRIIGFETSLLDAKELAKSLEVKPIFIEKRVTP